MTRPPASVEAIERREFEAAALMRQHPPAIHNPNKQIVFDIACPPGAVHWGRLGYSRWAEMALPDLVEAPAAADLVAVREGFFSYVPFDERGDAVEWHVNFADPVLFGYYGGGAFAQDEMQVAEHPALAALRARVRTVEGDSGVSRFCFGDVCRTVGCSRPGSRPGRGAMEFSAATAGLASRVTFGCEGGRRLIGGCNSWSGE